MNDEERRLFEVVISEQGDLRPSEAAEIVRALLDGSLYATYKSGLDKIKEFTLESYDSFDVIENTPEQKAYLKGWNEAMTLWMESSQMRVVDEDQVYDFLK